MGGAPQARGAGAERALPRGAEAEPPLVAAGGAPVQDPRLGCIASVNPAGRVFGFAPLVLVAPAVGRLCAAPRY